MPDAINCLLTTVAYYVRMLNKHLYVAVVAIYGFC